jgi:hypothetical protein
MNAAAPSTNLWTRLSASFARAFPTTALFVARMALECSDVRRAILARLRMLECYVRKLLFVEAAALPAPTPHAINPSAHRHRIRSERAIDLARPETWSTHFPLRLPCDRRARTRNRASGPHTNAQLTAFRIALRIEALRRVLNAPSRYAMRLRRSLHRRPELVRRYALRGPRRYVADAADARLTLDITSQTLTAIACLDTS